jgi:hypothetical protein
MMGVFDCFILLLINFDIGKVHRSSTYRRSEIGALLSQIDECSDFGTLDHKILEVRIAVIKYLRATEEIKHQKVSGTYLEEPADLSAQANQLTGYDGCFYCAGISSFGMDEE